MVQTFPKSALKGIFLLEATLTFKLYELEHQIVWFVWVALSCVSCVSCAVIIRVKKQKCKRLLLPGPPLTTMIISTVSIIRASIQHCHRCEHYSSFAELEIIGRKTWNSPKLKDLCGPDVTMPHVAMNDSMPRGLQKTHSVYHQAKPVSISTQRFVSLKSDTYHVGPFDFEVYEFPIKSVSNLFHLKSVGLLPW